MDVVQPRRACRPPRSMPWAPSQTMASRGSRFVPFHELNMVDSTKMTTSKADGLSPTKSEYSKTPFLDGSKSC